jgi:hypothetical protein
MNTRNLTATLLGTLCLLLTRPAAAQLPAFQFEAGRVPVGTVFEYIKTNRDGTHPSRISVYVASRDRIESLKWHRGERQATLVTAEMDWSRLSVKHFESWLLARDQPPQMRATMQVSGDELSMSLMPQPLKISHFPWASYDFDFASLSLVMPQLRNPKADFSFWRTDYVYGDAPVMAELGEVQMHFERQANRGGHKVWRYSIGGPGLENKQGIWWSDRRTGLLVEYELPLGDEPGYRDVRLKLSSIERMSALEWNRFKQRAVSAH